MLAIYSRKSKQQKPDLTILPAPIYNPYFDNTTIQPKFILLHCSGYRDPQPTWIEYKVSTHFYIPEQNSSNQLLAYEVVTPPLRARHAGVSHWQNYSGLNDFAIGIEISMPNYARALLNESLDFTYFETYQADQINALMLLVKKLQKNYRIPAENVLAHADVAPWRKQNNLTLFGKSDPGPTLPWQQLALEGISQSINENIDCPNDVKQNISQAKAQAYLLQIGYANIDTDAIETKINLTLGAYRLHYMPDCYNSSTNYATDCYAQPFDEVTACNMYRLIQTQAKSTPSCDTASWLDDVIIGSGILSLIVLVIWCVKQNRSRMNSIEAADAADAAEDDYRYSSLNNN